MFIGVFFHFSNSLEKTLGEMLTIIQQKIVGPLKLLFFKKPVNDFSKAEEEKCKVYMFTIYCSADQLVLSF